VATGTNAGGPLVKCSRAAWLDRAPCALLVAWLAVLATRCSGLVGIDGDEYYQVGADTSGAAAAESDASDPYVIVEASSSAGGIERDSIVARPRSVLDGVRLPLVVSFHGHADTRESTAEGIRAGLPLEAEAAGAATFVYPRAPNSAWPFTNDEQRASEAELLLALIDDMDERFGIDRERVFLVGWDGGAFLVNALACRLPDGVLRGVAIHSGSLYSVRTASGRDFDESGGVTTCNLPSALLIWGTSDVEVDFGTQGHLTREYYVGTLRCAQASRPWLPAPPCVSYDACDRALVWCPLEGFGHALWPGAAAAIWQFIATER
jgi:poly(3-hydroxybutyrate) depolymerase